MKRSRRADPDPDGSRFASGVELFNQGRYWEAHEAWERVWLASDGARRTFLQGLIQLAAVYYHLERENLKGASRLRDSALGRLDSLPESFGGIALDELREQVRNLSTVSSGAFEPPRISWR